jgi:hypothetical protein
LGSRRPSVFDSFLAVLVVKLSFFRIGESIAGFLQSSEAGRVSPSVGMLLERFLSEGLFDVLGGGIFGNFQQLVKLSGVDLFLVARLRVLLLLAGRSLSEKHDSTNKLRTHSKE